MREIMRKKSSRNGETTVLLTDVYRTECLLLNNIREIKFSRNCLNLQYIDQDINNLIR